MPTTQDIYGTTVRVPPRKTGAERLQIAKGLDAVDSQIMHLVMTVQGEYPMAPKFGLPASVFGSGSEAPYYNAQIRDAILRHIWAVEKCEVSSQWKDVPGTELGISIKYWVGDALTPHTLTVPYWRLQEQFMMTPE